LESEHLVIEVISDRSFKVLPTSVVVTCPMETVFAGAKGGATSYDEWSDVF